MSNKMSVSKPVVDETYRMATARFLAQMAPDVAPMDFPALIDPDSGLRPLGDAISRANETVAEMELTVEYGPERGAMEAALLGILRRLVKPHAAILASDVFNCRARVATKQELRAEIDRLDAASQDMAMPLARRKELSDKAEQIRTYAGV